MTGRSCEPWSFAIVRDGLAARSRGEIIGGVIVEHQPGRTLADREALAALLGRPVRTIRRWCEPVACHVATRVVLYDAEHAQGALDGAPDVLAVTAREAEEHLGIRSGTVRQWASRGRVRQVGRRGTQVLYDVAQLLDVAATVTRRTPATAATAPGRGQPGERSTCRKVPKSSAA